MVSSAGARIMSYLRQAKNFDKAIQKLDVLELNNKNFIGKITIEEHHCNSKGITHGGFLAMLMDASAIISTFQETWNYTPGLTMSFDAKFISKSSINDKLQIEAIPLRITKDVAFVNIVVKKELDGNVVSTASALLKSMPRNEKDTLFL